MFIPFNNQAMLQMQQAPVAALDAAVGEQPAKRRRRKGKKKRRSTTAKMPGMAGEMKELKADDKEQVEQKATPKYKKAPNGRLTMGAHN